VDSTHTNVNSLHSMHKQYNRLHIESAWDAFHSDSICWTLGQRFTKYWRLC